jgi:hypothetical protein
MGLLRVLYQAPNQRLALKPVPEKINITAK